MNVLQQCDREKEAAVSLKYCFVLIMAILLVLRASSLAQTT
jgi:hypothetical protein